jgi:hypothetical protein
MVDEYFPVRTNRSRLRAVMQVGEFVEVSNNSDTDPCAWVGVVDKLGKTIKVRISRSAKTNTTATAILAHMQIQLFRRSHMCVSRCLLLVGASLRRSSTPSMIPQTSGSRYARMQLVYSVSQSCFAHALLTICLICIMVSLGQNHSLWADT